MVVLQRNDGEVLILQGSDRFQASLRGAERGHDGDTIRGGNAPDLHGVFLGFPVIGGVHNELDFAVLDHVEHVGAAFVELWQGSERNIS